MRISFGIPEGLSGGNIWTSNGYGYATRMIMNSLTRLGYDWRENFPDAEVELWFDQPPNWKPNPNKYTIGYHPWESTLLHEGWADQMNRCDEVWTPSPVVAEWYHKYSGITRPVYVFEHGVSPIWSPHERNFDGKLKFLHLGQEGLRKGFKDASAAYRAVFGMSNETELNFKLQNEGMGIRSGFFGINYIQGDLELNELVRLFHENHVYVYPSWGEGFGLTPLQAMATGMPTITLPSWAPYARFLNPNLSVGSELSYPPEDHIAYNMWKTIHPGKMWKPNQEDLQRAMLYAYENYEEVVADAMEKTDAIHAYYNWDRLTEEAFENLKMRL